MKTALQTCLAMLLLPAALAAAPPEQKLSYPPTRRVDQVDLLHGVRVPDPYRWLENDVRTSPEVAEWVAAQNKLTYAISLAQSQITSFSAAESRIRDADVAQEAANLTKAQVLQQASLAALAQANSAPQAVLSLLRG